MTAKEFASGLDNRNYGREMTPLEEKRAAEEGLVVVFGASDDLMEFAGSLGRDELDCFDGGSAFVDGYSIAMQRTNQRQREIRAVWCAEGKATWSYQTDIPHETFNIYDGEELYCTGIVFSVEDLP